jgi:hypothetical protein
MRIMIQRVDFAGAELNGFPCAGLFGKSEHHWRCGPAVVEANFLISPANQARSRCCRGDKADCLVAFAGDQHVQENEDRAQGAPCRNQH